MPKNLVVCCDGTNNEIAGDQTNVLRLFRMLARDAEQQGFYDAGVGTKADPTAFWPWRRFVQKTLDSAVGMSIRPNVLDAYRFLMNAYSPGDKIFLFGFSRGAYTVRALAGMIRRCGLLRTEHVDLMEYSWSLYSDEDRSGDGARQFGGTARIKKVFARDIQDIAGAEPDRTVPIHFVGVWDTVSSFGWLWDPQTLPDTRTNDTIQHFRHAVSIDETRGFFLPNHVEAADGQDCQVVWFAGVHADVGGGYKDHESGLARIALRWMLDEAKRAGLRTVDAEEREMLNRMGQRGKLDALANQHDEAARLQWRLLSLLPRIVHKVKPKGAKTVFKRKLSLWNWAKARVIPNDSLIHASVRCRTEDPDLRYGPKLPPKFTFVGQDDIEPKPTCQNG
jgi:uncharacterized protein (DUF2235 family)